MVPANAMGTPLNVHEPVFPVHGLQTVHPVRNGLPAPISAGARDGAAMARVFIPPALRPLTGGRDVVDAAGANVRQVIEALEKQHPGIKAQLCDGQRLRPGLSVAIGSSVSSLGLLQPVEADSEVHFLPAVGGG